MADTISANLRVTLDTAKRDTFIELRSKENPRGHAIVLKPDGLLWRPEGNSEKGQVRVPWSALKRLLEDYGKRTDTAKKDEQ